MLTTSAFGRVQRIRCACSAMSSPLTVTRTKTKVLHAHSGLDLYSGLASEVNSVRHLGLLSLLLYPGVHFALREKGWLESQCAGVGRGMIAFSSCGCSQDEEMTNGIDGGSSWSTALSSHAVDATADVLWTCVALEAFFF